MCFIKRRAFLGICTWSDTSIDCFSCTDFRSRNRYGRYGRLLEAHPSGMQRVGICPPLAPAAPTMRACAVRGTHARSRSPSVPAHACGYAEKAEGTGDIRFSRNTVRVAMSQQTLFAGLNKIQ